MHLSYTVPGYLDDPEDICMTPNFIFGKFLSMYALSDISLDLSWIANGRCR